MVAKNDLDLFPKDVKTESQSEYVCKILKTRLNMENAKPLSTPLSMHVKLSKDECPKSDHEKEFMSKIPYQSAVGSLMYTL